MDAPLTHAPAQHSFAHTLHVRRIGLWLFFVSDAFLFGGMMVARFYLLGGYRPHLEQFVGLIVTSVLLISSFFMNRAEKMVAHGDRKGAIRSLIVTIVLGLGFLIGVVGVEWQIAPFGPADGAEGAIFYLMTGMHAFHVLTGLIFLGFVLRNTIRGVYTEEKHWAVEAAANYWHFVDLVWIFFYPALYLIGIVR